MRSNVASGASLSARARTPFHRWAHRHGARRMGHSRSTPLAAVTATAQQLQQLQETALPLPWPRESGQAIRGLRALVTHRRRVAKLLQFVTIAPLPGGGGSTWPPAMADQAIKDRAWWGHPEAPGTAVEVQLIMGKTLETALGREDAIALMDSVKPGCIILVDGRAQPRPPPNKPPPPSSLQSHPLPEANPDSAPTNSPPAAAGTAAAAAAGRGAEAPLQRTILDVVCQRLEVVAAPDGSPPRPAKRSAAAAAAAAGLDGEAVPGAVVDAMGDAARGSPGPRRPPVHPRQEPPPPQQSGQQQQHQQQSAEVAEEPPPPSLSLSPPSAAPQLPPPSRSSQGFYLHPLARYAPPNGSDLPATVLSPRIQQKQTKSSKRSKRSSSSSSSSGSDLGGAAVEDGDDSAGGTQQQGEGEDSGEGGEGVPEGMFLAPWMAAQLVGTAAGVRIIRQHLRDLMRQHHDAVASLHQQHQLPSPGLQQEGNGGGGGGTGLSGGAQVQGTGEGSSEESGREEVGSRASTAPPQSPPMHLLVPPPVALDCEWKPIRRRDKEASTPVELLQLATRQGAWLIDLTLLLRPSQDGIELAEAARELAGLLGDVLLPVQHGGLGVTALGFGLSYDVRRLWQSTRDLLTQPLREVVEGAGAGAGDAAGGADGGNGGKHQQQVTAAAAAAASGQQQQQQHLASVQQLLADARVACCPAGTFTLFDRSTPLPFHCVDVLSLTRHAWPLLDPTPEGMQRFEVRMVGLSQVVEAVLGRPLDKREQLSNWKTRPLTWEQLTYARNDVLCLVAVHDALLGLDGSGGERGGVAAASG